MTYQSVLGASLSKAMKFLSKFPAFASFANKEERALVSLSVRGRISRLDSRCCFLVPHSTHEANVVDIVSFTLGLDK
jgi:hypothetical protein